MPVEELPGEVVVADRETLVERWKRSHRVIVPDADTGPGTQPDVDARVAVDAILPILAAAKIAGRNAVLEEARGAAADQWGEREGVGPRREAVGASGFVTVQASSGGGTIQNGDQLVNEETSLIYTAIGTAPYSNGSACPVIGFSTGPETNLVAGAPLKWVSPRPGIHDVAIVLEQSDGSGLTGGREIESDEEYVERIGEEKRTRAASGNDAEYQLEAQRTPAVSVQKAFTYPGVFGPGTTCLVFTLRPLRSGGSRIPNAAQVALVESHVTGLFPADDGSFFALIDNEDADIVYSIAWSEDAQNWEDLTPWPPYYAPADSPGAIVVSSAASATSFVLRTDDNNYTAVQQPAVGQTIGFYDPANFTFRRKRILSFTGTGPWTITADTTNSASDTSYTPAVGQRAMPWSDSLELILPGIFAHFDTLGPGEQFASFFDEGRRQKRIPRPPKDWPSKLTERDLLDALEIDAVDNVHLLEGDGLEPSVGTPGILSYILKLRYVSIFPEPS